MVKQISDNEIYLLIKYIKSVLWNVAKRRSCIEDAWYPNVNDINMHGTTVKTVNCVYRYVDLLYYKQRILLHVSATYCGIFPLFIIQ